MTVSNTTIGAIAGLCVALGAGGAYLVTGGSTAAAPEAFALRETAPVESTRVAGEGVALPTREVETVASPTQAPATSRPAVVPTRQTGAGRRSSTAAPSAPAQPSVVQPVEAPAPTAPALDPASTPEPEPLAEAEPPAPQFEELVISAESVIGLQIETSTTSDRAELEDPVIAHVTRDVRVAVGSSRVDLQACKLEYSIVSPK